MTSADHQRNIWLIKLGSALIAPGSVDESGTPIIAGISQQLARLLRERDIQPVLVSSGAIAYGMETLGWTQRPTEVTELQALAAVGQAALIEQWRQALVAVRLQAAQVLVNRADCDGPATRVHLKNALTTLFRHDIIPILNENDCVATEEIRYGDNDNLASAIAVLIQAKSLILLTDVAGLFCQPPVPGQHNELVVRASAMDSQLNNMVGAANSLGRGGMLSKLQAARRCAAHGIDTHIGNGRTREIILDPAHPGTHLMAMRTPIQTRPLADTAPR